MEFPKLQSFFQDIRSRELNGFRVRKRPYPRDDSSKVTEIGAVTVEHSGNGTPPMAISFCKTRKNSHILAVTDEDGYVSLYNTRSKLPSHSSYQENAERARVSEWVAHENAIFDLCWIKEDTNILTASGDQSIKVWDAQEKKCIAALMGHTGSVKCICSHPTNHDLILSGSRDGSFVLWDLRCSKGRNGMLLVTYYVYDRITHLLPSVNIKISDEIKVIWEEERTVNSLAEVHGAHISQHGKRLRRSKAASKSITSVLYLKDEISIATAGAVDSVVKFWDVRNLKRSFLQAIPDPELSAQKERGLHGVSSLSQDLNGVFISASCMDSRIYLYNVLQLDKGPVQSFSGSRIESFFVKSALSPDAAHILGGSSNGNAYIWQVNKPEADPILLNGHDGEVSAVDWCQFEMGKIATSSDDFTVRFWNIQDSCYSSTRSPSSSRRRIMALAPLALKRRKLLMDAEPVALDRGPGISASDDQLHQISSVCSSPMPEYGTPKSEKKFSSSLDLKENEKTPEAELKSPSSVLNPPSSLKRRTIRDYFVAAS